MTIRHALWCLRIRLARQSRVSRFRVWSHGCILPSLKPHMTRREAVCLQGNYRVYQCQHNIYPIKHSFFISKLSQSIIHHNITPQLPIVNMFGSPFSRDYSRRTPMPSAYVYPSYSAPNQSAYHPQHTYDAPRLDRLVGSAARATIKSIPRADLRMRIFEHHPNQDSRI
jgi:hypothetical protein